jgi:biotin carboxyl carrier protein
VKFVATIGPHAEPVEVTGDGGRYRVALGDQVWDVDARLTPQGMMSLLVDGRSYVAALADREGACVVEVEGETYTIEVEEAARHVLRTRGRAALGADGQTVAAPMPGRITHIAVAAGDRVAPGDTVVVIEAMKMENELKAAAAGTVREVRVQAGAAVNPGDVLVVIGADGPGRGGGGG